MVMILVISADTRGPKVIGAAAERSQRLRRSVLQPFWPPGASPTPRVSSGPVLIIMIDLAAVDQPDEHMPLYRYIGRFVQFILKVDLSVVCVS